MPLSFNRQEITNDGRALTSNPRVNQTLFTVRISSTSGMHQPGPSAETNETPSASEDINLRERTEALRWRSVFNNSAIGVALADANGRVLATNATYQQMLGYSESEFEGLSFLEITHEDYREHNWNLFKELLEGKRDQAVIATKFGFVVDEDAKRVSLRTDDHLLYVREECEASLRRLNTDVIDLYQLHVWDYPLEKVPAMVELLESLVSEGKIRYYGWSTDSVEGARLFADGKHCVAIQHDLNVMLDERGREFYWEGWRRHDLIRFSKYLAIWQLKPADDPKNLLFPIPVNDLAVNPNLSQNPGY